MQLKSIEADLEAAENELLHTRQESQKIGSLLNSLEEKRDLETGLSRDRKIVEKKFEALTMIEGIHNWKVVRADASKISIEFSGAIPELCFRLNFLVMSSGSVISEVAGGVSLDRPKEVHRQFTPSVKAFLAERSQLLQKEITSSELKSSSEIIDKVHQMEWFLGRLDIIGKEISMLEIRHSGKFERSSESSTCYDLYLSIQNKSTESWVKTTFEIGDWYPFVLDMDISGEIDVIDMERQLIKNAKPGYGYLSRACDVIGAFQGN